MNMHQKITRWTTESDGFGGFIFGSPEVLMGRWEDKNELFIDAHGQEISSQAVVYLEVDVDTQDFLYLGDSEAANPTDPDIGTLAVRAFRKTPNLGAVRYERKAYL